MHKPGWIYALINPFSLKIFYVGSSTIGLQRRLDLHISFAKHHDRETEHIKEIKSIIAQEATPKIIELEFVCDKRLIDRENEWIKSFHEQGILLKNKYGKEKRVKAGVTGKMMKAYVFKK